MSGVALAQKTTSNLRKGIRDKDSKLHGHQSPNSRISTDIGTLKAQMKRDKKTKVNKPSKLELSRGRQSKESSPVIVNVSHIVHDDKRQLQSQSATNHQDPDSPRRRSDKNRSPRTRFDEKKMRTVIPKSFEKEILRKKKKEIAALSPTGNRSSKFAFSPRSLLNQNNLSFQFGTPLDASTKHGEQNDSRNFKTPSNKDLLKRLGRSEKQQISVGMTGPRFLEKQRLSPKGAGRGSLTKASYDKLFSSGTLDSQSSFFFKTTDSKISQRGKTSLSPEREKEFDDQMKTMGIGDLIAEANSFKKSIEKTSVNHQDSCSSQFLENESTRDNTVSEKELAAMPFKKRSGRSFSPLHPELTLQFKDSHKRQLSPTSPVRVTPDCSPRHTTTNRPQKPSFTNSNLGLPPSGHLSVTSKEEKSKLLLRMSKFTTSKTPSKSKPNHTHNDQSPKNTAKPDRFKFQMEKRQTDSNWEDFSFDVDEGAGLEAKYFSAIKAKKSNGSGGGRYGMRGKSGVKDCGRSSHSMLNDDIVVGKKEMGMSRFEMRLLEHSCLDEEEDDLIFSIDQMRSLYEDEGREGARKNSAADSSGDSIGLLDM